MATWAPSIARTGALVALLWGAPAMAETVEEPPHELLQRLPSGVEIRQYRAQVRAVTTVEGPWGRGQSEGFRRLAGYIFGGNVKAGGGSEGIAMTAPVLAQAESQRIAMTAPVISQAESERIAMTAPVIGQAEGQDTHEVAFVMPAEYRLADLPRPKDPRVRLEEVPARRLAVLGFSWWATPDRVAERGQALRAALAEAGFKAQGPLGVAQYDPPWALPFLRRNEVFLVLE